MMKKNSFKFIAFNLFCVVSFAQVAKAGSSEQYEYPELSVAPRASDRIQMEADKEPSRQWTTFLPMQASALTTLIAGVTSYNGNSPGPGYAGIGTGAGWLVLTTWMSMSYRPYASAHRTISAMPKGNIRDQLTRERAAEEEIRYISATGQRLKWLSFLTNAGASAYMITAKNTDASGATIETSNTTRVFQYASAALSLAPLVFGFHWSDVYDEQKDYKKRIYSPVASATVFSDPVTKKAVPGLMLSLSF